ncbi:hypothetical protein J437_LFUL010065 [Ladona fulva]|uniref:Uncharacterized protein n=1 Tax=Ladona fulva TaxID=123851 RepID=A0A8K0NYV0_LADFU|nr:hypothetical protein J437_LFUL010065 [Ladona fulva]
MNEKDSSSLIRDTDMYNFEKRLRETLHELSLKRGLLDESRKELNQAFLVKYELERRLDRACREVEESRVQLELAVSTGRKWEEEREAVPLHRAHLQAAITERDSLKEEARSLQLENVKLKRKVEELEGQVHCLSTFQMTTNTIQSKAEETIREVKRQVNNLVQDHKRLELTVKTSSNLSNRLELATRHFNCIHEKLTAQLKKMEANTVSLTCIKLKFWKTSLSEMESRLKTSEDNNNKLQQALKSALETTEKFRMEAKEREKESKEMRDAKESIEQQLVELNRLKQQKDKEVQVEPSMEENERNPQNDNKIEDGPKLNTPTPEKGSMEE